MIEYVCLTATLFVVVVFAVLLLWRERVWHRQYVEMQDAYFRALGDLLDRPMARDLPELVQSREPVPERSEPMGVEEFAERIIGS